MLNLFNQNIFLRDLQKIKKIVAQTRKLCSFYTGCMRMCITFTTSTYTTHKAVPIRNPNFSLASEYLQWYEAERTGNCERLSFWEKQYQNDFFIIIYFKLWQPDKVDTTPNWDCGHKICLKSQQNKTIRKAHEAIWTLHSTFRTEILLDNVEMWLSCNYTCPLLVNLLSHQIFYQNSGCLPNSYVNQDQSINPLSSTFCQIALFCQASNHIMGCRPPLADKLMSRITKIHVIFRTCKLKK